MPNKGTDCSNAKEKMGKYVASLTDYDIPYMERPAIKGNLNHKRSCQSRPFACGY